MIHYFNLFSIPVLFKVSVEAEFIAELVFVIMVLGFKVYSRFEIYQMPKLLNGQSYQ